MKAALHALEELNALAWQQSLHEGDRLILPHDKLKISAFDELQSSLSMPDQISAELARPLLASVVDEVRRMTGNNKKLGWSCNAFMPMTVVIKRSINMHARQLPSCMFLAGPLHVDNSSCGCSCMSERYMSIDSLAGYLPQRMLS